jgi:GTP pyrophosphokinase
MDVSKIQTPFEKLIEKAKIYIENENEINIIIQAYQLANDKLKGLKRLDGSDYIDHPVNVAIILTDLHVDYHTLVAALLHEVTTLGNVPIEEIRSQFGEEITKLIIGINKINKISFSADSEYTINYYRKILVGLCEDVRVIFIKLSDRLHNMRTLWAIPEDKQKEKAKKH